MSEPRIIALQIEEASEHFHTIDYRKDLTVKLQKELFFTIPGLLTKASYFEDIAKTIPVLDVLREYEIHPITGKLLRKKTIRVYYNEDGTVNEEVKNTGWYVYTSEESRSATHRRRVNITNKLESDMLALLVGAGGSDPVLIQENIVAGSSFMQEMSPAISTFHLSGNTQAIVEFVTDTLTQAKYPFLLAPVAPNIAAFQYIIAGVTY